MRVGASKAAIAIAVAGLATPRAGRAQSAANGELPSPPATSENQVERKTSGLRVTTSSCPDLDIDRIEEHLRLELVTLVPMVTDQPPLDVDFHCDGPDVRVTVRDSVTAKWVVRDVVLSAPRADPERTLALAASELFLAAWAELLLDKPQERPAQSPVVVAAESAVRRAVPALANSHIVEFDVLFYGRERHLTTPVPILGGALRVGQAKASGLQLFATSGWEGGIAERSSGHVTINAGEVGMGLRWGWHLGPLRLAAAGSASAMYVSLQGVPSSVAFFGATHSGFTSDLSLGLEASVPLSVLRLGAGLSGGYLAPGPVGIVERETAVRIDGPWVGATLFCGFAL
jgi:hypothetical protein